MWNQMLKWRVNLKMMGGGPGFVQDFKFQQEGQMVAVYYKIFILEK